MSATILPIEVIVSDPAVRRGRPHIAGSQVTIADIIGIRVYRHYNAEEIALHFGLTLGQVFAALAYYYLHKAEIEEQMRQDEESAPDLLSELQAQGKLVIYD